MSADIWTTVETVAVNAEGRLTPAQRDRIAGRAPRVRWAVVLALLVPAPVAGWLFLVGQVTWAITVVTLWLTVVVTVAGLYRQAVTSRRRRIEELADPRVGHGIGQVLETAILVPEVNLHRRYDDPPLPPAGWYQLYWFAERGGTHGYALRWLLSAYPLAPSDLPEWEPEQMPVQRSKLMLALRRDAPELAENTAGRLSTNQRHELRRSLFASRAGIVVAGMLGVASAAVVPVIVWAAIREREYPALLLVVLAGGAVAFFGYWISTAAREGARLRTALGAATPVRRESGHISVRSDNDGDAIVLSGLEFTVASRVAVVFRAAMPYALYYVDGVGRLLSAEPVTLAPPDR
jgi:hypothetical protein